MWLSLYLLHYLFGDPTRTRIGVVYCAERLVMQEVWRADDRRRIAEYVDEMRRVGEASVDVPAPDRRSGTCEQLK
jgi:hypothetical protein